MENTSVDFSTVPAKIKCSKCGKEEELPPQKKLSETLKLVKVFEEDHKTCN